jgi:hypothetical protein
VVLWCSWWFWWFRWIFFDIIKNSILTSMECGDSSEEEEKGIIKKKLKEL